MFRRGDVYAPLISRISTYSAPSLDWRVAFNDAGVMPEVFAAAAAWVSVSAVMGMEDEGDEARKGWGEWYVLCGILG
jgi:hypothetical protein